MQIDEIWSISAERIRAFFLIQDDVRQDEEDTFSYGPCMVRILPLPPRTIGRFCFPQTQVKFEGPEPDTAEIHRRFVLQFISAGG